MTAPDWTAVLSAQGIAPERIEDARRMAEAQAAVALALPRDPLAAADPTVFAALIRAEARQ